MCRSAEWQVAQKTRRGSKATGWHTDLDGGATVLPKAGTAAGAKGKRKAPAADEPVPAKAVRAMRHAQDGMFLTLLQQASQHYMHQVGLGGRV